MAAVPPLGLPACNLRLLKIVAGLTQSSSKSSVNWQS